MMHQHIHDLYDALQQVPQMHFPNPYFNITIICEYKF